MKKKQNKHLLFWFLKYRFLDCVVRLRPNLTSLHCRRISEVITGCLCQGPGQIQMAWLSSNRGGLQVGLLTEVWESKGHCQPQGGVLDGSQRGIYIHAQAQRSEGRSTDENLKTEREKWRGQLRRSWVPHFVDLRGPSRVSQGNKRPNCTLFPLSNLLSMLPIDQMHPKLEDKEICWCGPYMSAFQAGWRRVESDSGEANGRNPGPGVIGYL